MKKSVKIGLVLLMTLCTGIAGCGKKKTQTTTEKKEATTTANQNNETKK